MTTVKLTTPFGEPTPLTGKTYDREQFYTALNIDFEKQKEWGGIPISVEMVYNQPELIGVLKAFNKDTGDFLLEFYTSPNAIMVKDLVESQAPLGFTFGCGAEDPLPTDEDQTTKILEITSFYFYILR